MSDDLAARFAGVRARTVALAAPLSAEDAQLQSMPEASPAKWHLAHTTWFFCRFVLGDAPEALPPRWDYLFNSYYVGAGPRHAREARGLGSRPSLAEVMAWRQRVDDRVLEALARDALPPGARDVLVLGTHHEEQHQELLLTDIKHAFWCNPLRPAYARPGSTPGEALDAVDRGRDGAGDDAAGDASAGPWIARDEGPATIGAPAWPAAGAAFAYDNETPPHQVWLAAHRVATRPVSNADYAAFVADGGYASPGPWLSDGWDLLRREGWERPLYWHEDGAREFTLAGWRERDPAAPVRHLSFFEADAFARWAGARLPTEAEREASAAALRGAERAWEWTGSAYAPYPGFRPLAGTLGEYNGKFMSGQMVLRGGSWATPPGHARASYRNFFPPHARWQAAGVRLARDPA